MPEIIQFWKDPALGVLAVGHGLQPAAVGHASNPVLAAACVYARGGGMTEGIEQPGSTSPPLSAMT